MRRPLFCIGLVFLAATTAFYSFSLPVALFLSGIPLILAITLSGEGYKRGAVIFTVCVLAAAGNCLLREALFNRRLEAVNNQAVLVTMTISQKGESAPNYTLFGKMNIMTATGTENSFEGEVNHNLPMGGSVGDTVSFEAFCEVADDKYGAFGRSPQLQLKTLPIATAETPNPIYKNIAIMRQKMSSSAASLCRGEASGLITALLTGDTARLDYNIKNDLRTSGLSHLIVLSGLHMAVAATLINSLLRRFSLRWRAVGTIVFCWGFVAVTGFGSSTIRAATMISIMQLGGILNRRSDGLTSLAFAGLVIALVSPQSVASISLWMSFGATAGILLLASPISKSIEELLPKKLSDSLAGVINGFSVSLSAQLATTPIIIGMSGAIPTWGVLANIPAVALVGILLPLGWIGMFIGAILPAALPFIGEPCRLLALLLIRLARFCNDLPASAIYLTERYQLLWLTAFYLMLIVMLGLRVPKGAAVRGVGVMFSILLTCVCVELYSGRNMVEVLVSQRGDSIAIVRGNRAVMVGTPVQNITSWRMTAAIKRFGGETLDCIIPDAEGVPELYLSELLKEFRCKNVLSAPTIHARVLCNEAGAELYQLPRDRFYPLGVPTEINTGETTFYFRNNRVLKSLLKCDIIDGKAIPLAITEQGILRYRFEIAER